MFFRLGCLVVAFFAAISVQPFAVAAEVPRYDALYVFGDSLSDTGNDFALTKFLRINLQVPPAGSYYRGRFSNGPIAFEYLWRLLKHNDSARVEAFLASPGLKRKGVSFAFGGAASGNANKVPPYNFLVPGLQAQVELLRTELRGQRPSANALFGIWVGANDYELGISTNPQAVVANITRAISRLYQLGARHFIVLNLPDLALTPLAQAQGEEIVELLNQLVGYHNVALGQALNGLSTSLPGVHITQVDIFGFTRDSILSQLIVYPPALDVVAWPGASFCLFTDPSTCPTLSTFDPNGHYLFWDAQHPTTEAHALLGQFMFKLLQGQ